MADLTSKFIKSVKTLGVFDALEKKTQLNEDLNYFFNNFSRDLVLNYF